MPSPSTTARRRRLEYLIDRAELALRTNPGRYRRRLRLLGLLGFGVVFGTLALILALVGGTAAAVVFKPVLVLLLIKSKLAIVLLPLGWVLIRSMGVKFVAPDGLELRRAEHPALFAEIDALRLALAGPPIHRVLLSADLNAAVASVPRLGLFGAYRHTLILGLPLLLSLSPGQARAVLAHEFGHLSSNWARFNARVYRRRARWARIAEALDRAGGLAVAPLRRFFDWYAAHYWAYSFPAARANELEADAAAARLTSGATVAATLVATQLQGDLAAERFWQPLLARADQEPEPGVRPYTDLRRFFAESALDEPQFRQWLDRLLARPTDRTDTPPCLRERLDALGEAARRPGPVTDSAAQAWLGEGLDAILAGFDRRWLAAIGAAWRARHEEFQGARVALTAITAKPAADLTPIDRWNLAMFTERLAPATDPLPLYLDYQALRPDDPDAALAIGRILLERAQPAGLVHLERAAGHRPLVLDACNQAIAYLRRTGDPAAAERWRERAEAHVDLELIARQERAGLRPRDRLLPAQLSDDVRLDLQAQVRALGQFKSVWIVRKAVRVFPESPLYVMVVQLTWFAREDDTQRRLVTQLRCPGETLFVSCKGLNRRLRRQLRAQGERLL